MLKALVVGTHKGPSEMLQRRVGGILKDIAVVEICRIEDLDKTDADIYISYSHGVRFPIIKEKFKNTNKKVVGAELTILPIGIRMLNTLRKGSKIGVIAEHLRCANYFLAEILKGGCLDYRYIAGTIKEITEIDADAFAIPEELLDLINKNDIKGKKILPIPRTITPLCAAEIINAVLAE